MVDLLLRVILLEKTGWIELEFAQLAIGCVQVDSLLLILVHDLAEDRSEPF